MKNEFGLTEQSYALMLQTLETFAEIERAVIFGSRALGTYRPGSDIDIAIYGPRVTPETAMNLAAKLNEATAIPYHADVVAPDTLENSNLIDHINRVGKEFYGG